MPEVDIFFCYFTVVPYLYVFPPYLYIHVVQREFNFSYVIELIEHYLLRR